MSKTFRVFSSNGSLEADIITGNVVDCQLDKDGEGIDMIERFDVNEYKKYYGLVAMDEEADILDLGSWNKDGSYSPPEMDFRKDAAEQKQQDIEDEQNKNN